MRHENKKKERTSVSIRMCIYAYIHVIVCDRENIKNSIRKRKYSKITCDNESLKTSEKIRISICCSTVTETGGVYLHCQYS
jgi:hypothetical protein